MSSVSPRWFVALSILVLSVSFGGRCQLSAQELPSGERVIERFLEVCGGREQLAGVESYKAVGRYRLPAYGMDAQLTKIRSEKGLYLLNLSDSKSTNIRKGFDGTVTWQVRPQGFSIVEGKAESQLAQDLLLLPELAYQDLANVAKCTGIETVAESRCYVVQFATRELGKQIFYYSIDSGFRIQHVAEVNEDGFVGEVTQVVREYARFGDLTLPKLMTQTISNVSAEVELEAYEFGVEHEPSLFASPETDRPSNK